AERHGGRAPVQVGDRERARRRLALPRAAAEADEHALLKRRRGGLSPRRPRDAVGGGLGVNDGAVGPEAPEAGLLRVGPDLLRRRDRVRLARREVEPAAADDEEQAVAVLRLKREDALGPRRGVRHLDDLYADRQGAERERRERLVPRV